MLLESSAGTFLVFVNCVDYIVPALTVIEVLVHSEAAAWLPLAVGSHLGCHAPGVAPAALHLQYGHPVNAVLKLKMAPALLACFWSLPLPGCFPTPNTKHQHSFRHLSTTLLQPVQCSHLGWHAPGVDPWWGCWNSWPACLPPRPRTWQASWTSTCPSPPLWKTCSPREPRGAPLQPPGCWPVRTDLLVFWCLWGFSWQRSVRLSAFGACFAYLSGGVSATWPG